ncbi:MAG: hypothetical protein LBK73_10995 [Treponema sp.]|nr:hypothetical protein [Treponema sp.]
MEGAAIDAKLEDFLPFQSGGRLTTKTDQRKGGAIWNPAGTPFTKSATPS